MSTRSNRLWKRLMTLFQWSSKAPQWSLYHSWNLDTSITGNWAQKTDCWRSDKSIVFNPTDNKSCNGKHHQVCCWLHHLCEKVLGSNCMHRFHRALCTFKKGAKRNLLSLFFFLCSFYFYRWFVMPHTHNIYNTNESYKNLF